MTRFWNFAFVGTLVVCLSGCGNTQTTTLTGTESVAGDTPPSIPDAPYASTAASSEPLVLPVDSSTPPHEVVLAFLNAMKDGNGRMTAALLTTKAQEETVKHDWPVQPPGAPTATYQLGQARYANEGQTAVLVPCVWTETDEQFGPTKFEVEWLVAREQHGWRVAGFTSEVVPGRGPSFFNFEDIADLKATQSEIEAALAQESSSESAAAIAREPATEGKLR